jgi:uncharacterized protein (TIGR02996 family)
MTTRADLEDAILADPDSRDAYAVYADWLLQHGDPDGELIAVQLALEDVPGDAALLARERELVAAREPQLRRLYHYAVSKEISDPVWRRGLLHAITVEGDAYSNGNAMAYEELVRDPVSRFLRKLTVRPATMVGAQRTDEDSAIVDAIAALGVPRALRRLVFDPQDFQISWTRLTDLSPIYRHLDRLEELVIQTGEATLGAIELPGLRSFELVTGGLRSHALASIAAASWPRLQSLVVYLGAERYGGDCTLDDLAPLLDGSAVPSGLRTLGLCNCEFGDELALAVARAPILPRLRHLSLSHGTLGDMAAGALLEYADAFRHLETLDISNNYLAPEYHADLSRLCPHVDLSDQNLPDPDGYRYVTVSE